MSITIVRKENPNPLSLCNIKTGTICTMLGNTYLVLGQSEYVTLDDLYEMPVFCFEKNEYSKLPDSTIVERYYPSAAILLDGVDSIPAERHNHH